MEDFFAEDLTFISSQKESCTEELYTKEADSEEEDDDDEETGEEGKRIGRLRKLLSFD